ncbi:MAG: hypothetical protein Ct9H90mP5_04130 [Acidimicrobiaceae bacterium]|nr:MAG: hypothetical protein Ct9H90mP5_04130 [Acidimicrobiaceae bacterium]
MELVPLKIGFALIPLNVVPLLTAAVAGKIVDRQGPRPWSSLEGYGVEFFSKFLVFSLLGNWYILFALGLLVSGLGAMAIGNNTTIATYWISKMAF